MGGNLNIENETISSKTYTFPITLSPDIPKEIINQNYLIHIVVSALIYVVAFLAFYFLKFRSLQFDTDNLILFAGFICSVIVASTLSKKYNYIKHFEYTKTLGKLFISLLITLSVLIIFMKLFKIHNRMPIYLIGALLWGFVIETFYFIILGAKEKSAISFIRYKKISLKYLISDFLILAFFCFFLIAANLVQYNDIEREIILISMILIGWLISGSTTHMFLPLIISNSRWNAFGLQVQFYFKIFVLVLLFLILLNPEISTSINIIKTLIGYTLVSSLISMFVFADKVDNKTDEPTVKFLRTYDMKDPLVSYDGKRIGLKYSFTGVATTGPLVKQNLGFEYLKEYKEVFSILDTMLNLTSFNTRKSLIIKSDDPNTISLQQPNSYQLFVNLHILNDQNNLNDYLRNIRNTLVEGGVFVGAFHPHLYRYNRFLKKYSFWIGNIFYFFDLIWKRVFPKLPFAREIYFTFRKGKDQAISLAEGLGRLVYTGYKILDLAVVNNVVYFAAVKNEDPMPGRDFLYNPIIKLKRIGKGGKAIYIYKIRTMYPYSEYIQQYLIEKVGYDSVQGKGKLRDDFRVTFYGKFLRKYWLDELPQLINVLKGEMKLIGLRPIGEVRYNEFPDDLKKERIKFKPGCIPPYVSLRMTDEKGNIEAERIYIKDKLRHPFLTDIKYFYLAIYNILIKKIRSA